MNRMNIVKGKRYVNIKNGKTYVLLTVGRMKVNSGWVSAISYRDVTDLNNETYTRQTDDFKEKFKEI